MNPKKSMSVRVWIQRLSILLVLAASACSQGTSPEPEEIPSEATTAPEEGGETQDDGPVTVTFAANEYDRGLYEPLIEEFNEQSSDITVQFVPIPEPEPGEEPQEINYTRLQASTGDTSLLWGTWSLGTDSGQYFRDLGPLLDADPSFEVDDLWPGILNACQDAEGRILGLPFMVNFNGIFFDKSAFDEAGLPHPTPGWTWDDFQQAASTLAEKRGDAVRYGYADQSYIFGSVLAPLVDQHLVRHDGEIDAKAMQDELQWYFDLANAEAIYPIRKIEESDWGLDWEKWQEMFKGENRPAMWTGNIMEPVPGENTFYSSEDPFSGLAIKEFGFVPYPVSEDRAASNTTPVYGICGAMSAGTEQPRAAWAWLSFLSRHWLIRDRTQAYEFMQLPSRQSVADEVGYWDSLPEGVEPTLRFSIEHAWFGSLYLRAFEAVNQALGESLSGKTDLIAAVDQAKAVLASTPQPTPDTEPVVVASPPPPPPENANVVEYYYEFYGPGTNPIKDLIETFNQANPDVFIKSNPDYSGPPEGQDYFEWMTGKYDCLTWYKPSFEYQKPTTLLDLTSLVETEDPSFIQDFSPEQLEGYRYEGQLLGIPAYSQPQVIAYNADLLDRRGLEPPDSDWTFDDFIELATRVASTSEADKSYGFIFNEWENLLLTGRGVQWADLSKDPPVAKFDSPEMVSALEWLADLAENGVILVQTEDNWATVEQAFSSGQMAFWTAQAGNKQGWYWYPQPGQEVPQIGVAPMPAMPPSDETVYWSSDFGHMITTKAEDPQACWSWIKFLSEQPTAFQGIPARLSVANSPEWEAFIGPEDAAIYRLAAERVQPVPTETTSYSRTGWPFYQWRSEAVSAVMKGEEPKEVLSEAQRKAEAYLSCIGVFDVEELSDEDLQSKIGACARQVDPQGNWPP